MFREVIYDHVLSVLSDAVAADGAYAFAAFDFE